MEECKHGLRESHCASCKSTREPFVYVSRGGDVYHVTERCSAYHVGRRKAAARFGAVYPLEHVSKLQALAMGRRACDVCAYTSMISTVA